MGLSVSTARAISGWRCPWRPRPHRCRQQRGWKETGYVFKRVPLQPVGTLIVAVRLKECACFRRARIVDVRQSFDIKFHQTEIEHRERSEVYDEHSCATGCSTCAGSTITSAAWALSACSRSRLRSTQPQVAIANATRAAANEPVADTAPALICQLAVCTSAAIPRHTGKRLRTPAT